MINGHGDDTYRYQEEIRINFSSNVYYGVSHTKLFQHLTSCWNRVCAYPEPQPYTAEQALADTLRLHPEEVCMTNGATEAIYLIAQAFSKRCSGILMPTFSEYADACRLHGHRVKDVYDPEHLPAEADIIWVCNPNNPTGHVIPLSTLKTWLEKYPSTLFVIDQSYEHFTEEALFTAHQAVAYPNLILLHSMTKQYALPGLRIGYLTASAHLTARIRRVRMPWSVNQPAIEATLYLLSHAQDFAFDLHALLLERQRTAQKLAATGVLEVWPSQTHILLVRLRTGKASALKEYLATQRGMLIRDAANFEGLNEQYFRIAIQKPEDNDQLVEAIQEWIYL